MKVILLMLICALCGGMNPSLLEASPRAKVAAFKPTMVADRKVSITFTGTVKSIEMLGAREMSVVPVDFDPRFAVTVRVESVTPKETPLKEGEEIVFAIHSQTRLFHAGDEDVIGKKYRFKLAWEQVSNGSRFSQMTASPKM